MIPRDPASFKCCFLMTLVLLYLFCVVSRAGAVVNVAKKSRDSLLNVHVVPHSHCDPGWLFTVDEYYQQRVKFILDTVVTALMADKSRKFHWAETSYFSMWWNEQTSEKKAQFKSLLHGGQWQWLIGGWVMSDNALTTYSANINQMTLGHTFLRETFGEYGIPKIGWDIDPFGLSQNIARMYSEMGFDYHVIARIDWVMKSDMKEEKNLEFRWRVDQNASEILTHVMFDSYCSPSKLDWEGSFPWGYNNETNAAPITPLNIDYYSELLVNVTKTRASAYRTNHLLYPFGCDFEYGNAELNFSNMTLLINHINSHRDKYGVNIQYSFVSEYFEAIKNASSQFPAYDSDFLPYSDNSLSYWTGYYTSRPELKKTARTGESLARTAEILFALSHNTSNFKSNFDSLETLRIGNGYIQHHDAITGTERDHVIAMYLDYIKQGVNSVVPVLDKVLSRLISKNSEIPLMFEHSIDETIITKGETFVPLVLFNSLGWTRSALVKLQLQSPNVIIKDQNGLRQMVDIVQRGNIYEAVFNSQPIPPLGFTTVFVQMIGGSPDKKHVTSPKPLSPQQSPMTTLSNSVYDVQFCNFGPSDTRICKISNKVSGISIDIEQNLFQYVSFSAAKQQSSGAYIFRSTNDTKYPVSESITTTITGNEDSMVQEITQVFSDYAKQTVRLYRMNDPHLLSLDNFVEIEFEIGEMELDRELVTEFVTNIASNNTFFTDDNAFTTMERTRYPNYVAFESGNYCPTQYSSFIRDKRAELLVLTDQSRGMTSASNGQVEYMLHRRTSRDDGRGLDRPLNDTTTVKIAFRLFVDTPQNTADLRRPQSYLHNFPIDVFRLNTEDAHWKNLRIDSSETYKQTFKTEFSAVSSDLPYNVHLLNLQVHSRNDPEQLLLRLHHIYEEKESSNFSRKEMVEVQRWLKSIPIRTHVETKLSANQMLGSPSSTPWTSHLSPSQIRTYVVTQYCT